LNKKLIAWIALVLIVGIGLIVFFTLQQRQKKAAEISLQKRTEYASAVKTLETEKKYLRSMAAQLGVNFFSRHSDSSQADISFFMFDRISRLANKWMVQLISFFPAEKEEKDGYTKIRFVGEVSATYPQMVHFFKELEEGEKLFLEDLKVTAAATSTRKHQAQFALSCCEFASELLQNLEVAEQVSPGASSGNKEIADFEQRDPFLNPFEGVTVTKAEDKRAVDVIDLSEELTLTGISSFPKPGAAIINHRMVKQGDTIDGREVVEIKEDQVVLKAGERHYILRMKGVASLKSKAENLLELQKETE